MAWPIWRAAVAGLLSVCVLAAGETLTYPLHQADNDPQLDYVLDVLRLAIHESGTAYTLQPSTEKMVQSREISDLRANIGSIDLMWTMTSQERERELLPIRIPIDRGLIGWRVALVRSDQRGVFAHVSSREALSHFSAGQMHDWPDTTILRSNGLNVETSDQYESLFKMLAVGRFDYFPRSLIEIENELASHAALGLSIEPHLLIRYPTALYFFVSPQRPKLAADLERGLLAAVHDGKLRALFERYFAAELRQLDVAHRAVIELRNPLLPPETPFTHAEFWYHPDE